MRRSEIKRRTNRTEVFRYSADDRRFLNTLGIATYSKSGIIGQPALGTQDKGSPALDSLAVSFSEHIAAAG
jgi:creatinine amidohydrolase